MSASRVGFHLNGTPVTVPDDGGSLLDALREHLDVRSPKDGCSPQGQCGCCTVLIDGQPRVACVTPARRIAGRQVATIEGLPAEERDRWADAFCATGASQCGFCTPGILLRLVALHRKGAGPGDETGVARALAAHLCRCTGWRTIFEAFDAVAGPDIVADPSRDLAAAARRASIEGGVDQTVGPQVVLGRGGFADDTAPRDALVAVPDGTGGWVVGETLGEARRAAGKVQGRRTTVELHHPLDVPPGDWDVSLRTAWVEPAYLETDASWCEPGGEPATPLGNGGAFGAKTASIAPGVARSLADEHGRAVRVVLSREDTVRMGPKRPPIAAGVRADGTGRMRVVRTPGVADAITAVAPGVEVEEVDVAGPPTSLSLRGAGWLEALVLLTAARARGEGVAADPEQGVPVTVSLPSGARATATVTAARIELAVTCGEPLDAVVLRSYCIGAAHMGLGLVLSEGIAVDGAGEPHDLTIRSFGILRPAEMPPVDVVIDHAAPGESVCGSDAVLAAVAASAWIGQGCPQEWPTRRRATR